MVESIEKIPLATPQSQPSPQTHWGIWVAETGSWLRFNSNNLFSTTSRAVAQAQMEATGGRNTDGLEIRPF